ncbi:MAG: nitroreductase family protein [Treponema sp.]|nr:nitroreductase family protein [Treponema sp.]
MNEIMKSIFGRKSVRQYESRTISRDDKKLILEAALQAPTAGNQNLYTILDITDKELKQKLSLYCDNQPFIAQVPLALIFLADCRRWYDSYQAAGIKARPPEEGDLLLAVADAVIAAQNTVVAAESLGIGSCYIGDILEQEENVRKALDLDEYVFPAAFVVYGCPTSGQKERIKPKRPPLSFIVQENHYRRLEKEEHQQMFLEKGEIKSADEYNEYIKNFYERKYNSSFAHEMNRCAKRYMKHFTGEKC